MNLAKKKTTRIIASRFKIGGSSFYVSSAFFFLQFLTTAYCLLPTPLSSVLVLRPGRVRRAF